ncbi:MAG: redox-sensitive bicupin YhaK (pirin superfamily) [Cellvibrionaceae bacterium]|jgi:redox-sensitive bicupin YhaK (pirin superfamily)
MGETHMKIRHAEDRGIANFDWLKSRHSFSFGHYYDPQHMGFGPLRVINDDRVDPGAGFPPHGHADMEIISYVVSGGLEHKDSIGTGSVILPGDVQRMSAGKGIRHSEYNASAEAPVHFLQIWIIPETQGIDAGYEQKRFFEGCSDDGQFKLVGSRDGRDGSITIHQDVNLYAGRFGNADAVSLDIHSDRLAWVQLVQGEINLKGEKLTQGDGVAFEKGETLSFSEANHAEVLVFDMTANS